MSKTLSVADAQAANIKLVEGEKGAQAVHDLVTAYAQTAVQVVLTLNSWRS